MVEYGGTKVEWGRCQGSEEAHLFKGFGELDLRVTLCGSFIRFTYDRFEKRIDEDIKICPKCILLFNRKEHLIP